MTKRLFFTCPIKALYMMKEFRVKFECDYLPEDDGWDETDSKSFPFDHCMLSQPEMIEELLSKFNEFRKIYICKESEHIFEPKEGDIVKKQMFYNNKLHHVSAFWISKIDKDKGKFYTKNFCTTDQWIGNVAGEIIMRDNKQFFAAEMENA